MESINVTGSDSRQQSAPAGNNTGRSESLKSEITPRDAYLIAGLKSGNDLISREFFYQEIGGVLHRIRNEVYHGLVDFDELVSELYLYLSRDNWSRLGGFEGKNGCRLRTWMIPVAWRFLISVRERLLHSGRDNDNILDSTPLSEDLRIQISIDVNAVLARMGNRRYAEVIRLLIIEGYPIKDVAEMLGTRVENLYNLKHRAIARFLEIYGER